MMLFGLEDPWIWGAYLGIILSIILSTLLCIVYGAVNWNKGD